MSLAGSANHIMWFGLSDNHAPHLLTRPEISYHSLLISLRFSNHDPRLRTREPTPRPSATWPLDHAGNAGNAGNMHGKAYDDAIRSWAQAVTRRPISVFRTDLSTD